MSIIRMFAAIFVVSVFSLPAPSAEVSFKQSPDKVSVRLGDDLFTEYLTVSGTKPICWPILAPGGAEMTRRYPMAQREGEKQDHPHHRSMWFTHGSVNGIDFWAEGKPNSGRIVHQRFVEVGRGTLVAENLWQGPDGRNVCDDRRRLAFGGDHQSRWIDFEITLTASYGPVVFGDTKEGTFGLRVAETMKVDAKQGGRIVNSEGLVNNEAWGKRAAWVDYHGPVDGKVYGIAVFNHPSSFRYPTYWHVRTYGLFAANPFGIRDFTGDKSADGSHTLAQGESLTLRYRVFIHHGNEKEGRVAEAYQAYCALK